MSQRTLLMIIMGTLVAWALYVAIGAYWYNFDLMRAIVVLACMAAFLGIWLLLFWSRGGDTRSSRPVPAVLAGASAALPRCFRPNRSSKRNRIGRVSSLNMRRLLHLRTSRRAARSILFATMGVELQRGSRTGIRTVRKRLDGP